MASIIKNRAIVNDDWTLVRPAEDGSLPAVNELPAGKIIVPLAFWQAERDALSASRGAAELGVWLAPDSEPADIAGDFDKLAVIAVDFPVFRDGRGYSIGRLLRERYGYKGELRAIGDVLRDQVRLMLRCGFDAITVIRSGQFTLIPGHVYGVTVWCNAGTAQISDASLIIFP